MNRTYASIKRGLEQAIRHQKGKRSARLKLHVPPQVDVKAVRERTGLTQEQFAATFAISLGALRHWEHGDRYLRVIYNPGVMPWRVVTAYFDRALRGE